MKWYSWKFGRVAYSKTVSKNSILIIADRNRVWRHLFWRFFIGKKVAPNLRDIDLSNLDRFTEVGPIGKIPSLARPRRAGLNAKFFGDLGQPWSPEADS